jgi:hypothetical protein
MVVKKFFPFCLHSLSLCVAAAAAAAGATAVFKDFSFSN